MSLSTVLMSRGMLCSFPASVPCSVAPEKPMCRPQPPQVRRTFSLDTILSSYLLGQWPRDADGAFTCCTNDKATQVMLSSNWIRDTDGGKGLAEEDFGLLTNSQSLKLFSSPNVYQLGFLCKLA